MSRLSVLVLVLPLFWSCTAAPPVTTPVDNFDLCLRAQRACVPERLDADQRATLERRAASAHLDDCMQRRRCNQALLSAEEAQRVRQSVARLNHAACLRGEVECDAQLLDAAQAEEVARVSHRRNLENCLGGLTLCQSSRLTADEAQQVREAYLARNFSGCMNTVGTLVQCNPDDLSADQQAMVRRRNLAVNYFLCASSAFGCDPERLTPEQRAQLEAGGVLRR